MRRSSLSVCVATIEATIDPTLEPASTRGSKPWSNSALTTPCRCVLRGVHE